MLFTLLYNSGIEFEIMPIKVVRTIEFVIHDNRIKNVGQLK